jgi:phosphatidylglycerophosphatase A
MHGLLLWVAQGFGSGRIPVAPGTFGSVVGLLWFAALLVAGNFWVFLAGILTALALSVWLCGAAEKILKQTDPGSIVLDEIAAVPVCFLPWVISQWQSSGAMPSPEFFFSARTWHFTVIIFALFRLFDVWKPWPVRQSQHLPGGWGVTLDDVLAAVYVALVSLLFIA